MNSNKRVVILVVIASLLLFIASVFSDFIVPFFPNFKNINIVQDIVNVPIKSIPKKSIAKSTIEVEKELDFDNYLKKDNITAFSDAEKQTSLTKFNQKLLELANGKKVKIRIAWFGDSVIEGDLVTQNLRELLQKYFDKNKNSGVGFMPIKSVSSENRISAKISVKGAFETDNFKNSKSGLFFSGYSYKTTNLEVFFADNLIKSKTQKLQKWLLYGKGDSITISIDSTVKNYAAAKNFNRILLDNSANSKINFTIKSKNATLFGISSEPEFGLVLDNYSFRGITGVELKRIDNLLLNDLDSENYYDLVVFQYGVNLLFRPNDKNYDYYYKIMNPVLKKFKENMKNSEYLLISCSDKAFKYSGEWKTAVGIDSLLKTQAKLAFDNKIAFFNMYQSMGGNGSIIKWTDTIPRLANKDYIHFNHNGAKVIAKILFEAFVKDYEKSLKKKPKITN